MARRPSPLTARRLLGEVDAALVDQVAAYRGGYLPEERRELEEALRSGRLLGLAATNALELGIDISGLDAVLLAGFPGTRAALWQQVGRAGRGARDALGVMVARDDPLDTYLVNHPEALLGRPVEANVFDPDNPYVLGPHLCAAAAESPLTLDDLPLFGPGARTAVDALTEGGLLRRRPHGWFWTDRRRASDLADIRSSGGTPVRLVEDDTGRVLGTVDHSSAHGTAHAGAVYLHQGETWLVTELDLDESVAVVVPADPDYSTSAREITDIEILREREAVAWGEARLSLGDVRVTHQVVSFLKRRCPSGEVIGEEPLDLPERQLRTTAVWWTLPEHVLAESGLTDADLPGAAHAAEHASIGLLPLFATCDRWDIGGVSTALHPDTGRLTVFVHDGHPGGAGFAERGFHAARRLAARDPRGHRLVRLRRRVPLVRPVAEVRQPEQPARQGRRDRAARPPARGRSRATRVAVTALGEGVARVRRSPHRPDRRRPARDRRPVRRERRHHHRHGLLQGRGPGVAGVLRRDGHPAAVRAQPAMFRIAAKRAAARRADRKRVSELSNKLDEYKRDEREDGPAPRRALTRATGPAWFCTGPGASRAP